MKKTLKILALFIFCLIIFSLGKTVQANSIDEISMDIYVDSNGNAKVTETWNCKVNSGTEVYHPYYNLGNSKIQNLTVSENEIQYQTLSGWNTEGSLISKAYKCGINRISNGVELCWGMSQYGTHTYVVNYEITNFVSSLTDSQMIYWTLIPYEFSNSIGKAYIKIHTDFTIPDTTDVWGYGNYGGTAYVYNGYIEMQSDGQLDTDEYMTILVKFPLGTFNTMNSLKHNFDYYYNMAQEGSTAYKKFSSESIALFVCFLIVIIPLGTLIVTTIKYPPKKKIRLKVKKMSKNVPYYRDIPCDGDIFRINYIANIYGIINKKTNILGAIILKWLKNSLIRIEQKESEKIFKQGNTVIILNETDTNLIESDIEKRIFEMLKEASKDGILENKEFEKWCKTSYDKILDWFEDMMKKEKTKLTRKGLIKKEEKTILKIFKIKRQVVTQKLTKQAEEIMGLKRYLLDYSLIKEREAIEVKLFEDYLVFAQIIGIAKEVAKEFKDLYPEVIEQSNFNSYDNIIFINMCARQGVTSATNAKSAHDRASSYYSGGGGFSSGGGGGGSFGGGGGGGGFR